MKQTRIKGQALALVLIIVVVSVIIGYAITTRVIQDIQQQSQEKASTQAETIAESAVENITQKIQAGELRAANDSVVNVFGVGSTSPTNTTTTGNLDLCSPNDPDMSKRCDSNSIAKVSYFKMIIQFKLFSNENLEVHLTDTTSTTPISGNSAGVMIHMKRPNGTADAQSDSLLIKALSRGKNAQGKTVLTVSGECMWNIGSGTGSCIPANSLVLKKIAECQPVSIDNDQNPTTAPVQKTLGDYCVTIAPQGTATVSFYRVKPLLKGDGSANTPYIDLSATGVDGGKLPIPQMALINAGVYSANAGSSQQVFQQSTRLVLLNKAVPEVADYVLYNGADAPITK